MFQLARVGHVVARLVLGEDFHQWAELQPPLLLRDPVAEEREGFQVNTWSEHAGVSVMTSALNHVLIIIKIY